MDSELACYAADPGLIPMPQLFFPQVPGGRLHKKWKKITLYLFFSRIKVSICNEVGCVRLFSTGGHTVGFTALKFGIENPHMYLGEDIGYILFSTLTYSQVCGAPKNWVLGSA